jgi:intracellular sulfur oxidation DsrE/DsrF family protein
MLIAFSAQAQNKKYKAVWDLSSSDTTLQAAVFRQINNSRAQLPDLEIEVVFHGKAVYTVIKDSTLFTERIRHAKSIGVNMVVCNNSLKRLNIDPQKLSADVSVVPSAMVELIKKQEAGWSYIKAAN